MEHEGETMNGCVYQTENGICKKYSGEKSISWCVGKGEPCDGRVPSQGDVFRGMTDMELAEWFDLHTAEAMWCNAPPEDCPPHNKCVMCILDWLNSPVKGE